MQVQIGSTTDVFAGATTLMGAKAAHQIKRDTKMKPTTRREWAEVKRDVNDS